jgi:uracil-DNA glycosylase
MYEQISQDWKDALNQEFEKDYFLKIEKRLDADIQSGIEVYPQIKNIFRALELTSLSHLKVVILGQDPYHTPGMATGLSFSVPKGQKLPPSLKNIYKELQTDFDCSIPMHGCLENWAKQGVLLLNTCLTVQKGVAYSHSNIGWQIFTNFILQVINAQCNHIVFILWGKHAHQYKQYISASKHLVLESAHPSPLSAHNGFWNSKPFSKTNDWLIAHDRDAIDWSL